MEEIEESVRIMRRVYRELKHAELDATIDWNDQESHHDPVIDVRINGEHFQVWWSDGNGACEVLEVEPTRHPDYFAHDTVAGKIDPEYVMYLMVGIQKMKEPEPGTD